MSHMKEPRLSRYSGSATLELGFQWFSSVPPQFK